MSTNILLTGTATGPREESDVRMYYGNVNQIICASTNLDGTQPMSYSTDGGQTWNQSSLPAVTGTSDVRQGDPSIDWTSDGTAWSVTIGINATTAILIFRCFKSTDQGATWTFDSTVTDTQTSMDKEAFWIDHSPTSPYKDNMYLIWHNNLPCFTSVRKGPSGTWSAPQQISGSETTGTAIGGDIKTNAYGDVFAFWPDTGSQNLYVAKSTDGGTSFGSPVTIAQTSGAYTIGIPAQDDRRCLIYLSGAAYRTAAENFVYAVWMDLAGGSGCNAPGDEPGTDVTATCKTRIWFSRSTDGGNTWSSPVKLNDENALNDQFFSRLALDETSGALMVVYYDTIDDPGRLKTDLWMQTSSDNGFTWSAATKVTTAETNESASASGEQLDFQYGDYIGLTGYEGNFFACWTDRRNGGLEQIWGAPLTTTNIQIALQKSTYGKDEVGLTSSFAPAYWIEVTGFSDALLGLTDTADLSNTPSPAPGISVGIDSALNPSLTPIQISSIASQLSTITWSKFGPVPIQPTDPTFTDDTQTFFYPYTVTFPNNSIFSALSANQTAILTINASLTVGQITRTASANIELTGGEDPYFEDLNPSDPAEYPSWLSFDLRFFKVAVPNTSGATASRFGATMSNNPADAPAFIAKAIANLTAGGGSVAGDTFDNLSEDEDSTSIEFLPQDASGNYVFNFAVARVRLKGNTPGAKAQNCRVFFRLFQAATTATYFDTSTTYRYWSDGHLFGTAIPLLGIQNNEYVTIPCFATPRVNLTTQVNMNTQLDPPNAYTINVNPGVEVDSFYGCWLDVNQPQQKFLALTPPSSKVDGPFSGTLYSLSQVIARAPHQCLVAEIRFDDTPIPVNADTSDSDKLAQRNIAWIDGPNPGVNGSRRMPHPFDVRATPAELSRPDELLVFWGNTPKGSTAQFYLPAINASTIIGLASALYPDHQLTIIDPHTIQCPVGGATLIPIPNGTERFAGLLTVDLPASVKRGDEYTINVLQLTQETATTAPPPPPIQIAAKATNGAVAQRTYSWREVLGAFQISIPISTKSQLLAPEEELLAWLLWIQETMPATNRWYPVFQRYISQISGRVSGFGGNPGTIVPSPTGGINIQPQPVPPGIFPGIGFTGKVVNIVFDRFGDFEGFVVRNELGELRRYRGHEARVEELVRFAWRERTVITVFVEPRDPAWPALIVLDRLH